MEGAGSMVGNHNVARFSIESQEGGRTCRVFGLLAGKGKIDGEALEWHNSSASGIVACSAFL
jgi:hypothetical protein